MKRSGFKRKRPTVDPLEKKIRASARDENCTLRIDTVCWNRTDTTVYCHSNLLEHGKGMGLKASTGCYGCFDCHNVLDGRTRRPSHITQDELTEIFLRACEETHMRLVMKGLKKNEYLEDDNAGSNGPQRG